MMPVIWQQQEDKRVGYLPRGSSGESNLGEGKSVQFEMLWLWSSCKAIGRRHSACSLHVALDAEEVWAGERERELGVVSSYIVSVLGQCGFREAKGRVCVFGEGHGGGNNV